MSKIFHLLKEKAKQIMSCEFIDICGGCPLRHMDYDAYCQLKITEFNKVISSLKSSDYKLNPPIFIPDSSRRRACFNFSYTHKKLQFGFNASKSNIIIDINHCSLLTPSINEVIPFLRNLITALCQEPLIIKKGKKTQKSFINSGDVFVCDSDSGIDIVLEIDATLSLNHLMIISEMVAPYAKIIRLSHRRSAFAHSETLIEKIKPLVKMGNYQVMIPAGTFLQPSAQGQQALAQKVTQYISGTTGNIADLFCGVGTFSYLLANLPKVNITSIDSSADLLSGFKNSVNANQINNIKIINKNLFKYPLDENELKDFNAVIFDPPRAGAKEQCKMLASSTYKLEKIIAISCNPATFVNDANQLIDGGYKLQEITMVDQFVYSNHSELVAYFTKA